ncbi:acetylcholinesterase-like [Haemaphysalis longicornis]
MFIGAAMAVGLIVLSQVSKGPVSRQPPACPPPDTPLESDTVLLQTKVGRLKGRALKTDGVQLWRFRGVGFAESTAGERRFAKPVPLQVSDPCTVRPAISARHSCAQWKNGSFLGSEDCLHVSVWAPALPPPEGDAKRVLVVALVGSWFETGSNDNEDWSKLAAKGGVVVVAPNHRQGVLGFMHPPGVDELPKNVAVDDVVAGVQWAMDNAAAFHADPKRLVFVGHGSGAYMLSAAARLLPRGAVMRALYQGLVVGSLLPVGQVSRETFAALARALGCSNTENGSVASWIPCFRAAPIEKLVGASGNITIPLRFAPMVDVGTLSGGATGNWPDTVLAGADRRDVITLLNDRILPLAKDDANATTAEAVLDYTARLFAGEKDVAAVKAKLQPRGNAPLNMSEQLANAMTVCPTRAAAKAANEGYHYSASASSPSSLSFQPPLSLEDIARFVLHGTPPYLANGSTWPSFRDSPYTRDYDNGTFVNLEAGCPPG